MRNATFHKVKRFSLFAAFAVSSCDQAPSPNQPGSGAAGGSVPESTNAMSGATAPSNPVELDRLIAERRNACGGKVGSDFGLTKTADFNSDGKIDYIVSEEKLLCSDEPAGQMTWGRSGPQYQFLVSTSDSYILDEGFSHNGGIKIVKRPAGDVIQLQQEDMSSEGCEGVFTITWSWNGKKMELSDRRNAKGEKVDAKGCLASASSDLPIKPGYYGYADTGCAVALRSWTSGITIDENYWGDIDGDYPLRPIKSLGRGRYRLGDLDIIRVTSPEGFVSGEGTEFERRFVWCAATAPK